MQSSSKHFVVYLTAELIYRFNYLLYISDYDKKPKMKTSPENVSSPPPLLYYSLTEWVMHGQIVLTDT